MAIQPLKGALIYPDGLQSGGTPAFVFALMDASGEKAGWVFKAPKAGTISKIGFRTGGVTTPQTLEARLESVGSDGNPSGSLLSANASGLQAAPASNTWYWVTLTAGASVVRNQDVAAVVQFSSTTGNLQIAYAAGGVSGRDMGPPWAGNFTSLWIRLQTAVPVVAIEYSDGSRPFIGALPISDVHADNVNLNSNPDEWGNLLWMPFRARIGGVWTRVGKVATTFTVRLYDANDNVLLEQTGLEAIVAENFGTGHIQWFTNEVTIKAWDVVRVTVRPETTTNMNSYAVSLESAAAMEGLPAGQQCYWTQRTNDGAWTDIDTKRALLGVVLTGIDDGILAAAPQYVLGA